MMGALVVAGLIGAVGAVLGWTAVPRAAGALVRRARFRELACSHANSERQPPPLVAFAPSSTFHAWSPCWATSFAVPAFFERALCALLLGVGFFAAALMPCGLLAFAALSVCLAAMALAVSCDVRARVIPVEACATIAVAGLAFQALVRGWSGVVAGAACALAVALVGRVANAVLEGRCPEGALGGGDTRCMMALSLACGMGAPCGFAVCFLAAGAFCLAGCAIGKLALEDGIPLAPFLGAWLIFGAAAC